MFEVWASRGKEKQMAMAFENKSSAKFYMIYFEQWAKDNGHNVKLELKEAKAGA